MITINPNMLSGKIRIPPSKSVAHRAIICACLADEKSMITNVQLSNDILTTINAMKTIGAKIEYLHNVDNGNIISLMIEPIRRPRASE